MLHYGIMLMTAYEDGLPLEMEGTEEDKYLERYLDCILFGARFRRDGVGTCTYIPVGLQNAAGEDKHELRFPGEQCIRVRPKS
jgi:hypothetical protein